MYTAWLKKIDLRTLPMYWKVFIVVVLFISLVLAIIPFTEQYTFGFDQARDAYEAYGIWHNHDIKVLGPGTDIPGVYHGALWYYFLAILYGVGWGSPMVAGSIYFLLLFLTIFLVGIVAQQLFKNIYVSCGAMLLYALSPLFQAFSRWFSNPDLSILVMPFLLFFLWEYLHTKNSWNGLWLSITFGLLVQSDFGYGMFYLLLPVYLLVFRKKPTVKDLALFILGSVISLSTFILAELKFHFRTTLSVLHFFSAPHKTSSSVITSLLAIGQKYIDGLQLTVFPFSQLVIGLIIIVLGILLIWKRKSLREKNAVIFLVIWLVNIVLFRFFSTGLTTSNFVFAPSMLVLAMLCSYFLYVILSKKLYFGLGLAVLLVSQIWSSYTWIQKGITSLSVQQGIVYSQEKRVIAYTYISAQNQPFIISTVTNPLYINTLWSYLYEFEGKPQYGYMPFYEGKSQVGYLGNMPEKNDEKTIHYLIIEPTAGIPDIFITKAIYTLDLYTDLIEEKHFGNFVVQKRKYHPHKGKIPIPPMLKNSPILYE